MQFLSIVFAAGVLVSSSFGGEDPTPGPNVVAIEQNSPDQSQQANEAPSPATEPAKLAGSDPRQPSKEEQDKEKQEKTGTSNDRLFWMMPNFLTVSSTDVPRLTAREKFKEFARSSFDYFEYPWYGIIAGVDQAANTDPTYGRSFEGYTKRYATVFADGTIQNFMVGAVVPSILHQDPRYYPMAKGGFLRRTGYALSRLFVTRSDAGTPEFNFSEVFGGAVAAGVTSFSYHPASQHNIGNATEEWGTQIGFDGITTMLKEFWPDMERKFHRKH